MGFSNTFASQFATELVGRLVSARRAIQRVTLGPVDSRPQDDVIFAINPNAVDDEYSSDYVSTAVPLSDQSPNTPSGNPPSVEWVRNQPKRKEVEFLLYAEGFDDVEIDIMRLESFRYKDSRTHEPPDLVFRMGVYYDRVRLERLTLSPERWTRDLRRQRVRGRMTLIVVRPQPLLR
jgi:hypothetical protein